MLGCAAVLAGEEVPVMFVAFNREEEGFIGSSEFVDDWQAPRRIVCAHVLEMLGYASKLPGSQKLPTGLPIRLREKGDFLGLLANGNSATSMELVVKLGRGCVPELPVTGLEVVPGAERVFPVLARSDHVPFWGAGMPAMMWTDTAEFRNPNYHQASDTPETLDYEFLERVTKLLAASVYLQGKSAKTPE
jgi:Zn-dependent M28 family amino/carboxypeptidase